MTAPHPQQSCSNCGSARFGIVRNLQIDMVSAAETTGGREFLKPRFDMTICEGCGLTQIFVRNDKEYLLRTCDHEVVDLSSPNPYR